MGALPIIGMSSGTGDVSYGPPESRDLDIGQRRTRRHALSTIHSSVPITRTNRKEPA